jgi:hypothetical protein
MHIPAKMKITQTYNTESFNPPAEYLLDDDDEKKEMLALKIDP